MNSDILVIFLFNFSSTYALSAMIFRFSIVYKIGLNAVKSCFDTGVIPTYSGNGSDAPTFCY